MRECIISLSWDQLDPLLDWLDGQLAGHGVPTVLRLRVGMVTEELFSALLALPEHKMGRMRCTLPAPGTVKLEYRTAAGPLAPDMTDLQALVQSPATYGLKLSFDPGACTVLVGQK